MQLASSHNKNLFRQARRARGSLRQALEEELVLGHLDIAETAARNYVGTGRELDDLKQVARMGLLKAVRGFDPERGTDFPAYAMPTVTGELKRYLRDSCWVIRPPRHVQDLRTAAAKAGPALAQRLGRDPFLSELAEDLGESLQSVAEALNCQNSLRPESLEADADGRHLADTLGGNDNRLEKAEEMLVLRGAIRELDRREQQLLYYRYFEEESQQRVGERVGMTQMQVSRALARILVKLQRQLLGDHEADTARVRTA
ncbi:sigma-70 family RNA polymerase sigma factor [Arthrobacter crystallopoietes]|jgi:RNA polymerase sigma-B factor|uniref:sigma-70 family RNA polymerase sigma factor n=1 Tax=Crystallibacter crystallopoietes TaxID=37928 RepID=UPI0011114D3A|nr:sigma-70 family RNA polymerase sigma factor [Arthrobacter crystallopoietes]QTG81184.1 sigma-70 family RNA polymerase sigma factor [Arthrobacter crystallopoietes]